MAALPAGQTAAQDLNGALTNIFNHPNVGPFVSKLLIQHLVSSNPSPAYVQRVAAVFANNGSGVRGDLKAVVTAILMDAEARQGDAPSVSPPSSGHLNEPVIFMVGLLRALGATVDDTNGLTWDAYLLGQSIYNADSVFNYYSPSYAIPGTGLLGPEFQLQTPSIAIGRANWASYILTGTYASNKQAYGIDLTSFVNLAGNPAQLVDAVDAALTCGQMPATMKNYHHQRRQRHAGQPVSRSSRAISDRGFVVLSSTALKQGEQRMYIPSRRKFLSVSCRSLASIGTAGLFSRFGLMNAMAANPSNYRALVCVFLIGGNDGNNTVVPITTASQNYQSYSSVRQGLALAQGSLLPIPAQKGASTYGLHPRLVEIQQLYLQKKAAIVTNVGMLVKPITRAQYQAQSVPAPQNLFSHSDQQDQWQTSYTNSFSPTGWAGRAADAVQSLNAPSTFPQVVSVAGSSLFCIGQNTLPTTVTPGVPLGLSGFGYGTQAQLLGFQQLLTFDNGLSLVQASNAITTRGINDANTLNTALSGAPAMVDAVSRAHHSDNSSSR